MFRDDPKARAWLAQILPVPPGISPDSLIAQNPIFYDLPALLEPQEPVFAYAISRIDDKSQARSKGAWLVVCTDRRLLLLSRTLRAFEHFSIGRREIAAVDETKGWIFYNTKIRTQTTVVELFQYGKPDMQRVLAALRG